ncbi:MAG: DUF2961 domain-containing protein [Phycisphaerae bacterium]|nr:DUF2961 domain-containing protein [Phycisphaerae bacterium]
MDRTPARLACVAVGAIAAATAWGMDFTQLPDLIPGRVRMENALWLENPLGKQFKSASRVVVADLKGPGMITMIHFAMPQASIATPKEYALGRDLLLQMYWDDEQRPSVICPLVDFFCDPAGLRDEVNTALVNKRRGYNCYFPMPFRRSARVELIYDGPEPPGERLWQMMPCYAYVMWRTLPDVPADQGYFHAQWRQRAALIGKEDYVALGARGRGKFIGWNVTVRRPGMPNYPVDMNEKFFIDGEQIPSVEFQGIEDSFGFSWGFPETESVFPLTGYWPFMQGATAYRFFLGDAISFEHRLRVSIGFGQHEDPTFREQFSKPGSMLQLSSTCYWYQTEPHIPFPVMPPAAERCPAPEEPFWPDKEELPSPDELSDRGVRLHMLCGRPEKEVIFAEQGFEAVARQGYAWTGWTLPVYHCRADAKEVAIELAVPASVAGTLRVYVIDPDRFAGGRRQKVLAGDREAAICEDFVSGRWLEIPVTADETSGGKLTVKAVNLKDTGNAVISIIEWVDKAQDIPVPAGAARE